MEGDTARKKILPTCRLWLATAALSQAVHFNTQSSSALNKSADGRQQQRTADSHAGTADALAHAHIHTHARVRVAEKKNLASGRRQQRFQYGA